ncbi:unnamed protein product [Eruca vesicaria subsp. sativa]|uniref:HMG box domain-containing protein n=1 Tax=Eruca vesicaria subsp. sativa TaxID=29727 RepID=A0ABC8LT18_ERUVS|nr:unnamed protein product [Eruca vesicaria subsp. sativa]
MIAIALFVLHECGEKRKEVKRFKSISSDRIDSKPVGSFEDEPRSPFVFFLEDFRESYCGNMVDASRICFTVWKNMSRERLDVHFGSQKLRMIKFHGMIDMSRNVSPSSSASSPASMSFLSNMEL